MNLVAHIWFNYIVTLTKTILVILVLLLNFKLVEKTILNTLIARLPGVRGEDNYDFWKDVIVVNLLEGITGALVPFLAYAADVCTYRYWMLVLSTITCIAGLKLNSFAGNGHKEQVNLMLFYLALGLMALAGAAQKSTLQVLVVDQLGQRRRGRRRRRRRRLDERRRRMSERQAKFWSTAVSIAVAIFAQLGPLTGYHFWKLSLVLMVVMVYSLTVFLSVTCGNIERIQIQNHRVPVFRYKWLALWICLVISSLVSALGSTFFFLEASRLPHHDNLFSILFLDNVVKVIEFVVSVTSSCVIAKLEKRQYNKLKMELVRIGAGIWSSVLCCVIATAAATHRKYESGGRMSMRWLFPQYLILGAMSGLAKDGFQSLSEFKEAGGVRYGQPLGEAAKGVGSFLSVVFILVLSRRRFEWFRRDLGSSHLNNYYSLLSVLSLLNLMIFCLVAFWYICESLRSGDEDTGGDAGASLQQQSFELVVYDNTRERETERVSLEVTNRNRERIRQGARERETETETGTETETEAGTETGTETETERERETDPTSLSTIPPAPTTTMPHDLRRRQ